MKPESFQLSSLAGHIVTLVFALILFCLIYFYFRGEGDYSFLFLHWDKNSIATLFGIVAVGAYLRRCNIRIPINHQGIQEVAGTQTGAVWGESLIHLIPWPVWDIRRIISIEHISFTVAAQNRTSDGFSMLVTSTGVAKPLNVFRLAKIPRADLKEQLFGAAQNTLGRKIHDSKREDLLSYMVLSNKQLSDAYADVLSEGEMYGLAVKLTATQVTEVDPNTMKQFEAKARTQDMQTMISDLKKQFPKFTDAQLYAAYATLTGHDPHVMSYVIEGDASAKTVIFGNVH